MKYAIKDIIFWFSRRSREGAWIEIRFKDGTKEPLVVAPARERGLKLQTHCRIGQYMSRSREGAWIEIKILGGGYHMPKSLPRGSVD